MHKIKGLTPRELWEYAQTHPNHHWTPQSVLHDNVQCMVVRLEGMHYFWHGLPDSTKPFPQVNETHGKVPYDMELMDEVLTYYADDLKLWERAECR
jgi:hypothetical protein